jgi:dipeptidyl aminopeptidase/acylaminoacyl peptidase
MHVRQPRFFVPALFALATFAATAALDAQTASPHFPTSEDLRHTRAIGDPQLSPDAKQAIITVTDSTADGGKSHLWLVDIAGNTSRQLTYSPASEKPTEGRGESHGRWMPDNSAILFLAKRGETTQVFRLPMTGGEAIPYDLKIVPLPAPDEKASDKKSEANKLEDNKETKGTKDAKPEPLALDIDDFALSADGRWLAILAKDPQTAAEKKKDTDKDDADFIDHDPHGVRLYLQALDATGTATDTLIRADIVPDVQGIAWAPRSTKLAVVTETPNNVGDLHPARSAWVLERSGESWKSTALPKVPATVEEEFAWTKNETGLIVLAQAQQDAPPGVSDIYLTNTQTGETHPLSRNFPGTIHQVVAADDKSALVAVTQGVIATAAQFPLTAGTPTPVKFELSAVNNLNTNAAQSGWLYLQSSSGTPPQLCFARTLSAGCTKLNTPAIIPADWRAVPAQVLKWKSGDLTVEGILYLPPQTASQDQDGGRVPLIVDVHGGPTGQFTDNYSAFAQFLLGQGWAVLETNPRGSTGYGAAFAAANKNDLGGGDYQDIMAGVDTVLAKFPIDANKMALIGYSYGGEMAGFVEGKTDRFRAIVSGAPVIDQMSEYGTESSSYYDRWWYGYPWEHQEDAWRQSPIAGVAHAKTPFLLLQGKDDTTDPAGQSEEMYRALRQAGVTVELIEYPRENHGPLAIGMLGYPCREPWHGFDARKRIVDFINKQFGAIEKK